MKRFISGFLALTNLLLANCKKESNTDSHQPEITANCEGNYLITSIHHNSNHYNDTTYYTYGETLVVSRVSNTELQTNRAGRSIPFIADQSDSSKKLFHSNYPDQTLIFFSSDPDSIRGNFNSASMWISFQDTFWGRKIR